MCLYVSLCVHSDERDLYRHTARLATGQTAGQGDDTSTIQVRYKYDTSTIQARYKYETSTIQVRYKYDTNAVQVGYTYGTSAMLIRDK